MAINNEKAVLYSKLQNIPRTLELKRYLEQTPSQPKEGRHILAQYDDDTIVVYQAFCPEIAEYAVKNQKFGGDCYRFTRMSWIKTSFCWMQYRSGWNMKPGQERTLAIRIKRKAFDYIFSMAFPASFPESGMASREEYDAAKAKSQVRSQWDPDYKPAINREPLKRRAIQLGLRGDILAKYATEWIVSIEDITTYVQETRERLNTLPRVWLPLERIYHPQKVTDISEL